MQPCCIASFTVGKLVQAFCYLEAGYVDIGTRFYSEDFLGCIDWERLSSLSSKESIPALESERQLLDQPFHLVLPIGDQHSEAPAIDRDCEEYEKETNSHGLRLSHGVSMPEIACGVGDSIFQNVRYERILTFGKE